MNNLADSEMSTLWWLEFFFNWFQNLVGKSRLCISEISLMGKKAVHVELLYPVYLGTSTRNMIHVLEDVRSEIRYCYFRATSSRTFNCTVSLHSYLYPKDNHTLVQVYQNFTSKLKNIFIYFWDAFTHLVMPVYNVEFPFRKCVLIHCQLVKITIWSC